jgi:hypothetical protein
MYGFTLALGSSESSVRRAKLTSRESPSQGGTVQRDHILSVPARKVVSCGKWTRLKF